MRIVHDEIKIEHNTLPWCSHSYTITFTTWVLFRWLSWETVVLAYATPGALQPYRFVYAWGAGEADPVADQYVIDALNEAIRHNLQGEV